MHATEPATHLYRATAIQPLPTQQTPHALLALFSETEFMTRKMRVVHVLATPDHPLTAATAFVSMASGSYQAHRELYQDSTPINIGPSTTRFPGVAVPNDLTNQAEVTDYITCHCFVANARSQTGERMVLLAPRLTRDARHEYSCMENNRKLAF